MKTDDLSDEHLSWLVDNRSRNQRVTLDLLNIIRRNKVSIESSIEYSGFAQELAGVAFSLWRAVFLSDLTEDVEAQMIDVERFLGNLISHNTIAYTQDRNAREWTFQYYLNNARQRLLEIARTRSDLIDLADVDREAGSAKEDWEIAQSALENGVVKFDKLTKI